MEDKPSIPEVPRGRFAPSPTGPLHLGSLTAALGSWLMARHAGGQWLLRVEDLDPPREVAGSAQLQLDTLARFGMASDLPIAWQSERHPLYAQALQQLLDAGRAFECRCSRLDLSASGGIHQACVPNPSGRDPAFRLRVDSTPVGFTDRVRGHFAQNLFQDVGDVVIRRADGCWAYQLAVVVDDAAQAVTEVVRGADLLDSTPRQIALQQALGLPTPGYAHLPVIRALDGEKLSKSSRAAALDAANPLPGLAQAFAWLGQDRRALEGSGNVEQALQRALAVFDPSRIGTRDVFVPKS